ncbi:ankyrin repeat domain-containing protein [bacterium]|nr:MAG: ankyrin repeat domain-containing protein [bacterium]
MNNKFIFIFLATISCATQSTHAVRNCLHDAAERGRALELKNLIDTRKYDINAQDNNVHNFTPLHYAVSHGYVLSVKTLLSGGANVNAVDDFGHTPLHIASWKGRVDCIKVLIENNAIMNLQDKKSWTPLHVAAFWEQIDCVKCLVAAGASICAETTEGKTPKAIALEKDYEEIAALLQETK